MARIENTVWMYWENLRDSARPPYLDLCLETIQREAKALEVRVLDERTVFDWLPIDPAKWARLPGPAKRSDYARTRLIYQYGGLWLDFDMLAMSPLERLLAPLREHELAGWGRELEGRFYSGLFAARPGCSILAEWIRGQDELLGRTEDWSSLRWGALVQEIIWPIARRSSYFSFPIQRIAPVPWYEWRRFFSRWQSPNAVMKHAPLTIMLWNSDMGPCLAGVSAAAIKGGRSLLSRLVRIATGETTLEEERDLRTRLHPVSSLRFTRAGRSIEFRTRRLLRKSGPGNSG